MKPLPGFFNLFLRPFPEPPTGFKTKLAVIDHFFKKGRRVRRILQMLENIIMDRQSQICTYHVGVFNGSKNRQPQAETKSYTFIHCFGISDSLLDNGYGLSPQGMLQTVPHKTGNILIYTYR